MRITNTSQRSNLVQNFKYGTVHLDRLLTPVELKSVSKLFVLLPVVFYISTSMAAVPPVVGQEKGGMKYEGFLATTEGFIGMSLFTFLGILFSMYFSYYSVLSPVYSFFKGTGSKKTGSQPKKKNKKKKAGKSEHLSYATLLEDRVVLSKEVDRLKEQLLQSSEALDQNERRLNNDMQRLKSKWKEKLEVLQENSRLRIQRLHEELEKSRAVQRPAVPTAQAAPKDDGPLVALLKAREEEILAMKRQLLRRNSDLETSRASEMKLRNNMGRLEDKVSSLAVEKQSMQREQGNLQDQLESTKRKLNEAMIQANDLQIQTQKLLSRKQELKCANRTLLEHLQTLENQKIELAKENSTQKTEIGRPKTADTGGSGQMSFSKPNTVVEPAKDSLSKKFISHENGRSGGAHKNRRRGARQSSSNFKEAAAQVLAADNAIVDYILGVVTSELEDPSFRGELDDSVVDALYTLVPCLQVQKGSGKNDELKRILISWAEGMKAQKEASAKKLSAVVPNRGARARPKTIAPPPGFAPPGFDTVKPSKAQHIASALERENVTILKRLFPEISNLSQLLMLFDNDVNLAASSILDELQSSEEHLKIWYVNENPNARQEDAVARKKRENNLKIRMRERYFMRLEQTRKCHPTLGAKLPCTSDSKVRWRNDRVVSTTGERFSIIRKESKEQIEKTSVSLAWIKRKRKGGISGGKIS